MKKIFYIAFLGFFVLTSCSSSAQKENSTTESVESSYQVVNAVDFKKAYESEANPQLIDVRKANEYEAGTIKGAQNQDILDGSFQKAIETLDKSKPVYVFCAVGGRSGRASKILKEKGFTKILDLKGGYNAWPK